MENIQFLRENDAITIHKDNGTDVSYYIFNEFEIHMKLKLKWTIENKK